MQSTFAQKKGKMTNNKQKASLEQPEVADTTFGFFLFRPVTFLNRFFGGKQEVDCRAGQNS